VLQSNTCAVGDSRRIGGSLDEEKTKGTRRLPKKGSFIRVGSTAQGQRSYQSAPNETVEPTKVRAIFFMGAPPPRSDAPSGGGGGVKKNSTC